MYPRLLKRVSLALLLTVLTVGPTALGQGDQVLNMIPADCLFCIRVNGLQQALMEMDNFLMGVAPMGVSMPVQAGLAQMLGGPQPKGVDLNGTFAFFALPEGDAAADPDLKDEWLTLVLPISDYSQFVGENPNVERPDENGVSAIPDSDAVVTQVGKYALLKSDSAYDKLVAMAKAVKAGQVKSLAGALSPAEIRSAMTEPLWAYGNIPVVARLFGPMIQEGLKEAKQGMTEMQANLPQQIAQLEEMKGKFDPSNEQGKQMIERIDQQIAQLKKMQTSGGAGPMQMAGKIMDLYALGAEQLMQQGRSLSLAFRPSAARCNLSVTLAGLPNTELADMFATGAGELRDRKLLGYLQEGAMINAMARMDSPVMEKFNLAAIDFVKAFLGDAPGMDMNAMTEMITQTYGAYDGPLVFSLGAGKPGENLFNMRYLAPVRDRAKFQELFAKSQEVIRTSGVGEFYKQLGLKIDYVVKPATSTYKGVTIDSAKFTIEPTDPDSEMGTMIKAMYGEGIDYRWCFVDNLFACTIGGQPEEELHKLIDTIKAGGPGPAPASFAAAVAALPQPYNADAVGTYNMLGWFNMFSAMMPMFPKIDVQAKSGGVAFAVRAGGGALTTDIALPKEHAAEFMQMIQQMQSQQKPQAAPPTVR